MADAIIKLGLDDSNFTSGIQSAQAEIDKFNRREGITNSKLFNLNKELNKAKREFLSAAYNYKKLGDEGRKTDGGRKLLDIKQKAAATIRELQATKNELQEITRVSNKSQISGGKSGLLGSLGGLATSARLFIGGAIATSVYEFGKAAIDARSKVEQLEISFSTLLGSQEKANSLLAELKSYGTVTPYDTEGLAQAARLMLSYGMSANKVMPMLKVLGDIAMGDKEKLQSLALAFSQMSASGRVSKQDLNQMVNAGFNPLQIIAEKTGKSIGELNDEVSAGKISVNQIEQAFISATSEGGKFHNMINNMSNSLEGKIASMADEWENLKAAIGGLSSPAVIGAIDMTTRGIQKIINVIEQLKAALGDVTVGDGRYNSKTSNALKYAETKGDKEGKDEKEKERIRKKTIQKGLAFEKRMLALYDKRISENARKQNAWTHPKEGKKPNPTLSGQRESLDYLRREQPKLIHKRKLTEGRIKEYENALKENPYKQTPNGNTVIANNNTHSTHGGTNVNNVDKIKQANSDYVDTINQLNSQLQDGMITTKEFDNKKKSALDNLIQAYYKEEKTVRNSSEMAALVKELGNVKDAVHKDMIEDAEREYEGAFLNATNLLEKGLITDEEYNNKMNQAKSDYAEKLIQLGNLTDKQNKNLEDTINDLKGEKLRNGTKEFKDNVKDITSNQESIDDKFFPSKKSVESQYNDTVQKYDSLKKYLEDNKANIGITISQEEYDKAKAQLEGLGNDASKLAEEFRKKKEFDLTINGLQDITSLGDSLAGLEDAFDSCKTAWDYFSTAINEGISIIQSAMQTISTITELINLFNAGQSLSAAATGQQAAATAQQTAAQGALATAQGIVTAQQTANVASSVAAIAANKALTASFMQLASASFYAAHAYIPFAGAAIAQGFIAAAQAHVIAVGATPYAEGGIIGGGSNHGDMQLARVNSGEMILNNTQQATLFDLLDGGASMVGNGGNVEFKIKGSDLYGSLRNYGSIKSKSGKKLKI